MGNYFDSGYEPKPYRDHKHDPAISMYITGGGGQKTLDKISCIWCKRTIYDAKGTIDKIIDTPMPVEDFDVATQIQCKLCKAKYRLLLNAK